MKLNLKKCVVLAAVSIAIPTSAFAYSFPFYIPEHGYFDITPTNTTQYNITSNEDLYGINLSPNESGYHTIFLDSINTNTFSGYCNYNWIETAPSTLCTSMFPMGLYDISSSVSVNNNQVTNVFPQYLALSTTTDLFATMGREVSALTLLLEQGKKYFLSLGNGFNTSGLRLFTKPDQHSKIVSNTCNWNGLYGNSTAFNCLSETDTHGSDILTWVTDEPITSHTQIFDSSFGNGHTSNSATTTATSTCTENCFSNVMFFPGIMGSRLYEQGTFEGNQVDLQRWSSSSDFNQKRLSMDANGYPINNLYTKADTQGNTGVTDEIGISGTALEGNIYKSFMSDLSDMKASSTIKDYSLIPYDWRLPLSEIVSKGKVVGDNLYYGTTTTSLSDSFIVQELQRLADTSKSGKVTVVAHSNGGLVTKELIQTLKETSNPLYEKIDKVIFVGVPQVGTPEAVTTMLHGSNIGPAGAYVSSERTRELFQNMPSMYNLLPSEVYFNNLSPLIEFAPSQVQQGLAYGSDIDTYQEYIDYLKGAEGRASPTYTDTISPQKANQTLLQSAINTHQRLDDWLPATTTKVYQVAGWGIYTPSGLKYSDKITCVTAIGSNMCIDYATKTTISDKVSLNGDGTVLSGSAQAMGESSQVENWWVNIKRHNESNFGTTRNRDHKSILEIDSLRNFIKNIIVGSTLDTTYLSTTEPQAPTDLDGKYTKYELHSPLHLTVIDNQGNITGYSTSTSQILEQIKGSQYLQSADVKRVIIPQNTPHTVILTGYDSGSFTLDINELQGDTVVASSSFEAIPNSTSTVAILKSTSQEQIQDKILAIDFDNDSTPDTTLVTKEGETVLYKTEEQPTATSSTVYGGSGGAIYYSPNILQNTQNTATTTATTTEVHVQATSTKEIELSTSTPPTPQASKTPKAINTPQKKVSSTKKAAKANITNIYPLITINAQQNLQKSNTGHEILTGKEVKPEPIQTTSNTRPILERVLFWVKSVIISLFK